LTLSKKFQGSGLLSTAEVAKELGKHRSTVWLWIRSKMLKSTRIDGFVGIKRSDLVKFQNVYSVGVPESEKAPEKKTRKGLKKK
jgi:excisionase family DNA binding protein